MPLNQAILDRTESFRGLYDPSFEHDACGVGLVASIKGMRSNAILKKALTCVCNLIHRGAMDADAKTGDGAGVLTQIPYKLFRLEVEKMGYTLFQDSDLGVGMMFLPNDPYTQARCRHITETALNEHKLFIFGWRSVPVNRAVLGEKALKTCPDIEQILVCQNRGKLQNWAGNDKLDVAGEAADNHWIRIGHVLERRRNDRPCRDGATAPARICR